MNCQTWDTTDNSQERELLWQTLQLVRKDYGIINGYLEFIITENGDFKFLDFKQNKMYVKNPVQGLGS